MNKSDNSRPRDSSPNGEARRGPLDSSPNGEVRRGLRNNNPLNIRRNPRNKWKGLRPVQDDPSFCQFTEMKWGIRAAIRLMENYIRKGFKTPRQIISRWAPPSENNTAGYVNSVAMFLNGKLGMDARMQRRADFCLLAQAMAWVETGKQLSDQQFIEGWELVWEGEEEQPHPHPLSEKRGE